MKKDNKILFKKHQMYKAKKRVVKVFEGTEAEQYGLLWRYAAEIVKSDKESTVRIQSREMDAQKFFKRFYCCWDALKKGMLDGCRHFIALDGCHLKTYCGGILLLSELMQIMAYIHLRTQLWRRRTRAHGHEF